MQVGLAAERDLIAGRVGVGADRPRRGLGLVVGVRAHARDVVAPERLLDLVEVRQRLALPAHAALGLALDVAAELTLALHRQPRVGAGALLGLLLLALGEELLDLGVGLARTDGLFQHPPIVPERRGQVIAFHRAAAAVRARNSR